MQTNIAIILLFIHYFQTGNAMKQREINMILSNNEATRSKSDKGESFVNLRILDVGEYKNHKCIM